MILSIGTQSLWVVRLMCAANVISVVGLGDNLGYQGGNLFEGHGRS